LHLALIAHYCRPRNSRAPPTRKPKTPNADFAPISAAGLFDAANQISVSAAGGQLTLDMRVYYTPPSKAHGTLMVCHHGAGYGGLSFACLAREVTAMTHGELGVMAFDARRHGEGEPLLEWCDSHKKFKGKTTSSGDDTDLSIDTLVTDFVALLEATFTERATAPHLLVRLFLYLTHNSLSHTSLSATPWAARLLLVQPPF
jgi:protein phosphatase methylesterase 1